MVPSTSRVVRVKVWPATRFSTPFLKSFRRISGPLVSSSAATGLPSSSRRAFSFSRRPRCSSWEPWEKLKRATFMPLEIRSRSTPSLSVEGPRVQIIFVFLMQYTSVNSLLPISGTAPCRLLCMTNGSKGSRYSGSVYVAEWKTQNSTTYYYNRSGAREQEEFLLEYKFLHLLMPKGRIVKLLTMCCSFLCAV